MPLDRTRQRSFHQLVAEVASAPLVSSAAFDCGLVDMNPVGISTDLPATALTVTSLEMEAKLSEKFSVSIDELAALRDIVWFSDDEKYTGGENIGLRSTRTIRQYLEALALKSLMVDGGRLLPHPMERDKKLDFAGYNHQRTGRQSLVWLLRQIPADLLVAVCGGRLPIRHLTQATLHALELSGFAETHLHLGASMSFSHVWPMVLNVVGQSETHVDEFRSPHSLFKEGAGLATWLLVAAIGRRLLAEFLKYRYAGETFAMYRLRLGENNALTGSEQGLVERVLLALHAPHEQWIDYSDKTFRDLQFLYKRLRRISCHPLCCMDDLYQSDPIAKYFAASYGSNRNVESHFLDSSLTYLREIEKQFEKRLRREKPRKPHQHKPEPRLSTAYAFSEVDIQFQLTFWQIQRIRCQFFRHLTQQQSVHGLVWFTRFYRRISPVKGGAFPDGLQLLAGAINNGYRAGLKSFEVRTQPAKKWERVLEDVQEIADAARHLDRFASDADITNADDRFHSEPHLRRQRRGIHGGDPFVLKPLEFEVGLVFHFVKERERGDQSVLSPFGSRTHEDIPRLGRQYRYSAYYRQQLKRADALAKVLREYPLSLQWIRGLDVCNDEQAIPVWVFRLLYKPVLEASKIASDYLRNHYDMDVPVVRPTAHVGEDFRHLLSGLRRIDEAVEALHIGEGDRLGHALALGTDPVQWATQVGQVSIDKLTRLFDLAWEWSLLDVIPDTNDSARTHRIELVMHGLIEDLFSHWNCLERSDIIVTGSSPHSTRRPRIDGGKITIPDIAKLRSDLIDCSLIKKIGYPNKDPYKTRANLVERNEQILHAFLTDWTLSEKGREVIYVDTYGTGECIRSVQDSIRRKVATRGIVVEVNPTSNLIVAGYANLNSHPLWRLNRPDYSDEIPAVDVCVGSDDPLVFATDLPQEYQRLADALADAGYSEAQFRPWLQRVQAKSLEVRNTMSAVTFRPIAEVFNTSHLAGRHY